MTNTLAGMAKAGTLFVDNEAFLGEVTTGFVISQPFPKPAYRPYRGAVVLGRFQPLHIAHIGLIEGALKVASKVLVVVGSAFEAQTLKNPFTFEMRKAMIETQFAKELQEGRLVVDGLEDYTYRTPKWNKEFKKVIEKHFLGGFYDLSGVCLYTYGKDKATKEYLNDIDKSIAKVYYDAPVPTISATDIRYDLFDNIPALNIPNITTDVALRLHSFKLTEEYEAFCKEQKAVDEYRDLWEPLEVDGKVVRNPFPVQFNAVDALVQWNDRWGKPHILVIVRKSEFGNGKLAIPGGYLDHNETILQGAVRELFEETGLTVDSSFKLDKVVTFDDPARSMRGRMMTHVHHWLARSATKPVVVGNDDASEAFWLPFDEIYTNKRRFFSDHYPIIASFFPEVEDKF